MYRNPGFFWAFGVLLVAGLLASGCAAPKVTLFPDTADPLQEHTLSGMDDTAKVLVITVRGIIDDDPKRRLLRTEPSVVEEVVSQLNMAEQDEAVRAVLLKIDSPGGSATAADLLYHEILRFKERSRAKVVAAMMNVAASGGYYIALPADRIFAHPTSITGSVGVVFLRPQFTGLMDKIGVDVAVSKSGKNKDMGSPFRAATDEEERILQELTDRLAERFIERVRSHRNLSEAALDEVATARIFIAQDAKSLGLVDEIGYLSDAVDAAKRIAGLSEDAEVVVYRRSEHANDTIYNPATAASTGPTAPVVDLGLPTLKAGPYYLWPTALSGP